MSQSERKVAALLAVPDSGWQAHYNAACFYATSFDFYRRLADDGNHRDSELVTSGGAQDPQRVADRTRADEHEEQAFVHLNAALRAPNSALPRRSESWSSSNTQHPRNWWDVDPDLMPLRKYAETSFRRWYLMLPGSGRLRSGVTIDLRAQTGEGSPEAQGTETSN